MFADFTKSVDSDNDYKYSIDEMTRVIDTFAHEEFLGRERLANIIRTMDINVNLSDLVLLKTKITLKILRTLSKSKFRNHNTFVNF